MLTKHFEGTLPHTVTVIKFLLALRKINAYVSIESTIVETLFKEKL